ncbi:adenosine deaminase [Thiomicrorhabdus sp. Kp2]|uniref:adenosine deaminase n=1 Tax=Thiomicrorhabdus sp. Kp2 TaxID=1123518 RepID=UPI00041C20A5|nr:adenosine deaminase [Thiomicrorhabdus sp. Kp2]
MKDFIHKMPKAELHLHIEGTLEPEMMFELAKRNGITLSYKSIDEIKAAYDFDHLQAFLDLYYQGMVVLKTEQDFFDLTWAYLEKCAEQNIIYVELFFDPQAHMERDIEFDVVLNGIHSAIVKAKESLGVEAKIIISILRHLDENSAQVVLDLAIVNQNKIIGIGLDSSEKGNPPEKFEQVYKRAQLNGFFLVAHAGEEGDSSYVSGALHKLCVQRIDHGNNALQDQSLLNELKNKQIALTLCPLSNKRLKVVEDLTLHPLKQMYEMGLKVTINSDDPAYFGGYLNENYQAIHDSLGLQKEDLIQVSRNAFEASFLNAEQKQRYLNQLLDYESQSI